MSIKSKSKNGKRMRSLSPNYTFRAPPYNKWSAFRPGGYYRMYHRVEAERMKRSHYWVQSTFIVEKIHKKIEFKEIPEKSQPSKANIKEGIIIVEIEDFIEELLEEIPDNISIIEE
ncbi:MAG: hypothetical protein ACXAC5_14415 [Promethearchaeota archaeon]|jgi:hypothetical protein